MQKNEIFETVFQEYTETRDVEAAEGSLMTILRNAFFAGWQAAKKESPRPQAEAEN